MQNTNKNISLQLVRNFPFIPSLIILIVLILLNGFYEPNSISISSLVGLISTYLALMLLAVAQTYVVMSADIDLSVGGVISLVNVSIVVFMDHFGGGVHVVLLSLLLGIIIGILCGLINGFVVAVLRLQAIVATFATSIFFMGLALYIMPVAGTPASDLFWLTYFENYFGIPFVIYALIFILLLIFFLNKSRFVTTLLAVGDGYLSAFQGGLDVTKTRVKGFLLCGFFSAISAFCLTGETASGDPLVGTKMTLLSVAAVVLGGGALSGGSASVIGSMIGVLIIGLINSLVFFIGTPSEWQNLIQGLSILIALMIGIYINLKAQA